MGNCVSRQKSGNECDAALMTLLNAMKELKERRDDLLRRVVTEEDEGLQRLDEVQKWLSRVEGAESQVSGLLEARLTQTKRLGLSGRSYGGKVTNMLKEVEGILSESTSEVVAEKIPAIKVEKKHIQANVGLDKKVRKAWKLLMGDGTRTLGLYGLGGIGKTTLLASINNKFLEVKNEFEFDLVMWVVVSKDFQYEGIQDQILRRLGLDKERGQETEEERANEIYNILSGKKFVLLLDDVWSKLDLNKVGVPPVTQLNGSKIVFTTRFYEACKAMEADGVISMEVARLSGDESFELFKKQLGESTIKFRPDLELLKEVSLRCYGLPLAVNVIGQSMKRKMAVHEWTHAIAALSLSGHELFLRPEEKILRLLKFTYDNLTDEKVKLCFLYCSLFPEDYEIETNELIEYWICEGFIDGNMDEDGGRKQGQEIIGLLVRVRLLMQGEVTTKVKMHDVVREMALWVATSFGHRKEILCVKSGVWLRKTPKEIRSKFVERISLMSNQIAEISCTSKCPKLLTLLLQNNKLVDISGEFFRYMPALVVLNLSHNEGLIGLPEDISNLGSLQYLNMSHTGIQSLPAGLKELRRLINLNLDFTLKLESIVGIAASFPNLQVLKFLNSGVCVDDRLMKELQLLKHLKVLKPTIADVVILESIQGIVRLATSIQSLCLRNMSAAVVVLDTVALGGLESLAIVKCKVSEIRIDWKSTESKEILPSTGSRGFKKLCGVRISDLVGPRDLTWLLYAQHLMYLVVEKSSSIEEIINKEKELSISKEHPHTIEPFGKLKHLKKRDVDEVKRILHPDVVAPFEKLDYLKVNRMDELKKICPDPQARLPNLRQFIVQRCPKLPLSLRDMQRNGWKGLE